MVLDEHLVLLVVNDVLKQLVDNTAKTPHIRGLIILFFKN